MVAAAAAQGATREEDLAALRARIEALRSELEGRQSERREARDALRDSERAISDANRALRQLEADARALRAALEQLGARRGEQARALEANQAALGRLLAARALAGAAGGAPDFVRVALSGEDLADAARRLHYLAYVSRAGARMIGEHRAGLAELARLARESEDKARELSALEARGRADRERLLRERREHRRLLERLAGEIRGAKSKMRVLLADESRLARLVEEIGKVLAARPGAGFVRVERVPESGRGDSGPFSALRGRLRLPVRGELSGRFGAARAEGGTPAKGVFIRAPEGEQVRAVAAGRVVYADWMRGFGNLLIVDHGENFLTIYGNNESLLKQTGEAVMLGEPLATVGASGGNEETGLYFELRHQGRPFDPLGWVKLR
ncbi:MAG: peptidoglycan DD-metalloendopeptidase family protein [Betaproteobacteria bacterium]|nr:peptidoglycan DD-metalloendopeptidase family protein [Betaproteobacteria bacterium]